MANLVTRTIKSTRVKLLGVNLETNEVVEYEELLPRTYKDEKAILKAIEKNSTDGTVKAVAVKNVTVEDNLYGMDEDVFIANAKILPPRKDYNKNDTENN